ncbi:ABC transporter ATP-binding protein [Salipaludibacillus sp. CUR1]|uniref:ABC transporter ATP-binding protein n=1 Tax=Salipaludibacillus sp. CUR1 TaxID=2820003 RepID=UPI001E4D4F18|nr:ABC transporter ATP-binding protein [Salipaludibacillus sp. CUR1]MCE7792661.1 ABC transporter ATP-binding protein [Salipaludibacillus sp. CUR1]
MLMKLENVSKVFADLTVFQHLNIEVNRGDIISLVGPSGCGKSTLLRSIAGLSRVSSGKIYIDGKDMTSIKAEQRPVVLMFQQPLLFPHLTILENVTYGLKYGKNKKAKKERIERGMNLLEKVELEKLSGRYPNQLSGGQQQRVALARALIVNPSLVLLDEPFSSLDPELRTSIRTWVRDFLKREGVTAVFVTHDREEAMIMGDRIAVMKDGKFQQIGAPEEVYQHPDNEEVAEMFSEGLYVEGRFISAGKLSLRPVSRLLASDSQKAEGIIQSKFFKYGLTFYHVHIPELNQSVVIQSNSKFNDKEAVHVCYKRPSVEACDTGKKSNWRTQSQKNEQKISR